MSKSIKKFNGLNGSVTAGTLKKIGVLAQQEGQAMLLNRINKALDLAETSSKYELVVKGKAIEQVPSDLLPQIEPMPSYISNEEFTGLNKSVQPSDIYDMITQKMIELIKKASGHGYKKKWKAQQVEEGYMIPFNFASKKQYRGINIGLLTEFMTETLENPFFMTFNQIKESKGQLIKGSKGFPVVYFTKLYNIDQHKPKLNFSTYDIKKFISFVRANSSKIRDYYKTDTPESYAKRRYIPILKYYNVFNGKDITGIDFDLDNFKKGYVSAKELKVNNDPRVELADLIVENYPKPQPPLKHKGNRAFYSVGGDFVQMPRYETFETGLDYYRTLLHEFIHSTGSADRLARDFGGKFGSKKYAREELVAEFGAVFLSAHAGIIWRTQRNHAEYIKNWSSVLGIIKEDNTFLMRAASKAQAATDFVLNLDKDGNPAFAKALKSKTDTKKKIVNNIDDENSLSLKKNKSNGMTITNIRNLKVYRHHSDDFDQIIQTSNNFILDESRSFNKTGENKNEAEFYFYAKTKKGAERYSDDEFNTTSLREYIIENANLLNLSIIKNRYALKNLLKFLKNKDQEARDYAKETIDQKYISQNKLILEKVTVEDIVNDNIYSGTTSWGQNATDFKAGIALKKDLKILGLDGIIFKDVVEEIALLKPAINYLKSKTTSKKKKSPLRTKKKVLDNTRKKKDAVPKPKPKTPARTPKKKDAILKKYDFIYRKGVDDKYIIKSYHNWSETRSLKWLDIDIDSGVEIYKSSLAGLKSLLKKYPNSSKFFKDAIAIKDLKVIDTSKTLLRDRKEMPKKNISSLTPKKVGTRATKNSRPRKKTDTSEKVDAQGQYALLGEVPTEQNNFETQKGDNTTTLPGGSDRPGVSNKYDFMRSMSNKPTKSEIWQIDGSTGQFLQAVERKQKESVVVILSTPKGTGKTTTAYKWINDFANNDKVLFFSLEEHHGSNLATDKEDLYISESVKGNINTASEIPSKAVMHELIEAHDVILFDSWQKLLALLGKIDLDTDLRKRHDGKIFIVIVQQTVDGKVKGGSSLVFDGDIIVMGEKGETFSENYLYFDKNRYTKVDLSKIRYNIDSHSVYDPTVSAVPSETKVQPGVNNMAFAFEES